MSLFKLFLNAKDCNVSSITLDDIRGMNLSEPRTNMNLPNDFADKIHSLGGTNVSAPHADMDSSPSLGRDND